jgi:hypothetical protein
LVPGAALPERGLVDGLLGGPAPDDPAAALTRCGPLAIDVRSRPVAELLTPAYRAIVDETD